MTSRERFELWDGNRVYFNSTNIDGPELAKATACAEEQNAKVLRIMQEARRPMTPWDVWEQGSTGRWLAGGSLGASEGP